MKGSKHLVCWEAVGQCLGREAHSLQGFCVSSALAPQPVCFLLSSGFVDVPVVVALPSVCTASHTSGMLIAAQGSKVL